MDAFRELQLEVMVALEELGASEKGTPENEKLRKEFSEILRDALRESCLKNVCASLVSLANSGNMVDANGFFGGGKVISVRDIAMLRMGLKDIVDTVPIEEQREVKISISIARPDLVSLFSAAIHGGKYIYWEGKEIRVRKSKYFKGLPPEEWPSREKNGEIRPDFRITPDTARYIYEQLKEKENDNPADPAEKPSIKERVRRQLSQEGGHRREAKFFFDHLPARFQERIKEA